VVNPVRAAWLSLLRAFGSALRSGFGGGLAEDHVRADIAEFQAGALLDATDGLPRRIERRAQGDRPGQQRVLRHADRESVPAAHQGQHLAERAIVDREGAGGPSGRLVRLAREGDPLAIRILTGIGEHLGSGIASLVNIFNPELIVVGGGFAAADDLLFEPAKRIADREVLVSVRDSYRIVRAELGTSAGMIGAGMVAFEALETASA